jgi:hypothetical protein
LLKIQDKWEYRDFLGNLGIFWELTWDFYKITVGHYFPSSKPHYRFSKVVSFWIVLLIRLGLELGLRLGLGVRVGVGFGLVT